jgi:hypothetical protein
LGVKRLARINIFDEDGYLIVISGYTKERGALNKEHHQYFTSSKNKK